MLAGQYHFTSVDWMAFEKKELELNLKSEQPNADWFGNKAKYTKDKIGVFCVGRNISRKDMFESGSAAIHVKGKGIITDNVRKWFDKLPRNMLDSVKGTHFLKLTSNCR